MGKNKFKPVIIILVILLIIGLIFGIYKYNTTDFLKSPKKLFFKYISNSFSLIEDYGETAFNAFDAKTDMNNFKETGNCTIHSPKSSNSYVLQTEYLKDATNSKATATLALVYDRSTLLTGKFNNSNDLYGVHIDGLTEKSVAVRNNSLQDLAKSLGIENHTRIPNRIDLEYKKPSAIIQDVKQIMAKYVLDFEKEFASASYSRQKDVEISIEGTNIITNKYTLSTKLERFYVFIENEVKKLKNDEAFLSLLNSKLNINNTYATELLDEEIVRIEEIIKRNSNSNIDISVYEQDSVLKKIEIVTDDISYDIYSTNKENVYKFVYSFNNVEHETRKTIETVRFAFENNYDDVTQDMLFSINTKKENNDSERIVSYDENNIKIRYALIGYDGIYANRVFTYTKDNKKLLEYKSKITIGVNAEIESFNNTNADILNDMTQEDLRDLITTLTTNAPTFIDVTKQNEAQELANQTSNLVDNNDADSAVKDVENALFKLVANYNINNEGTASLKDYFTIERLVRYLSLRNDVKINEEKNEIIYTNKINKQYIFNINILDSKIEVVEIREIIVEEPVVEEAPEEEHTEGQEIVAEDMETLYAIYNEITAYLDLVYQDAINIEDGIYIPDYINENQFLHYCPLVKAAAFTEQGDGYEYIVEVKDENENVYKGIIYISQEGIILDDFSKYRVD